jgi:aurora kinase
VYQLLTAICYMSVRSVIHRDLKLENVMVKDGDVKIIDFGWCVHTFRRRNTFCGTTEYLSPEMLNGGEYDSRLDVYTLGIMMYEMLYQRSPFY